MKPFLRWFPSGSLRLCCQAATDFGALASRKRSHVLRNVSANAFVSATTVDEGGRRDDVVLLVCGAATVAVFAVGSGTIPDSGSNLGEEVSNAFSSGEGIHVTGLSLKRSFRLIRSTGGLVCDSEAGQPSERWVREGAGSGNVGDVADNHAAEP